jgi:hypothetical protein
MLIHVYVFLSTIFLGLQGAAFYKYQINKLTANKVVQLKTENVVVEKNSYEPLWVDAEVGVEVDVSDSEIIKSPEEINNEIASVVDHAFKDEIQDESEIEEPQELANIESDEVLDVAEEEVTQDEVLEQPKVIDNMVASNEPVKKDVKPNVADKDEIIVFDYVSAQKSAPKVADIYQPPTSNQRESRVQKTEKPKAKNPVVDELLNEHNNFKKNNFTELKNEGEFKFKVDVNINTAVLEVRSLVNDEEVFFDNSGLGSIVKNFTSNESSELFQAIYPMSMPVNVKAYWHNGEEHITEMPLLEQGYINELYKEFNIKGEWGIVLTKIKDDMDYIDIEDQLAMVFLDENFDEVEENLAQYVLYLGVPVGNRDLKYIVNGQSVNYPIYVTENEITFVDLKLTTYPINKNFSIFERLPLGRSNKDVFLGADQIAAITSEASLEKIALNNYEYRGYQSILGSKESIVINSDGQNYFTDVKNIDDKIVLPSIEYVNQLLDTVGDSQVACIIELVPIKK